MCGDESCRTQRGHGSISDDMVLKIAGQLGNPRSATSGAIEWNGTPAAEVARINGTEGQTREEFRFSQGCSF